MKIVFIASYMLMCLCGHAQQMQDKLKPLFNGKNMDGWYSFLTSKGKNKDPEKVFAIENNLLHISGKEFGYICTEKAYGNFHLVVEFKWGEKKYPPRDADTTKRDNGILYFVPSNAADRVWPKGVECQIQEGDVGDFWMVDSATIIVDGKRTEAKDYCRAAKKKDAEKPHGEWNRVEVIVRNGKLTHIVNDVVVNEGTSTDLMEGKIIIQSEGAEIYYRKIALAEL